jgi:type II secretory pathway component GspD/PulD (secretin)
VICVNRIRNRALALIALLLQAFGESNAFASQRSIRLPPEPPAGLGQPRIEIHITTNAPTTQEQREAGRSVESPPTLAPASETDASTTDPATQDSGLRTQPSSESASILFRFEGASLAEILTLYSDLSRRTVIYAPGLPQGPVSVDVKTPLTKAEALLTLERLLYANGVSLTPVGEKLVKAFPNGSILREGLPIRRNGTTEDTEGTEVPEGDRITATIIPLKHIDVSDPSIIPTLSHFIHQPGGSIIPLHRSNSLLVVETTLNLKRLLQILENLDQPTEDRVEVKYYELRNIEASKMAGMLQGMMSGIEQRERRTLNVERPTSNQPAVRSTGLVARSGAKDSTSNIPRSTPTPRTGSTSNVQDGLAGATLIPTVNRELRPENQ